MQTQQNLTIYDQLDPNEEIEWIPSRYREEFIKQYRLKTNQEIKLTKGYDLFRERMNEWKGSDPSLKKNYEQLKKDAQIAEFNFMEQIMVQCGFDYEACESKIKSKLAEIKVNPDHKTTEGGETLEDVRQYQKKYQCQIIELYQRQ